MIGGGFVSRFLSRPALVVKKRAQMTFIRPTPLPLHHCALRWFTACYHRVKRKSGCWGRSRGRARLRPRPFTLPAQLIQWSPDNSPSLWPTQIQMWWWSWWGVCVHMQDSAPAYACTWIQRAFFNLSLPYDLKQGHSWMWTCLLDYIGRSHALGSSSLLNSRITSRSQWAQPFENTVLGTELSFSCLD